MTVKWVKKWFFLALVLGMGLVYLNYVDKWQVYAESLTEAKTWLDHWRQPDAIPADGIATEGNDESGAPEASGEQTPGAEEIPGGAAEDTDEDPGIPAPGEEGEPGMTGAVSGSGNEALPPADSRPGDTGSGQPGMPQGEEGTDGEPTGDGTQGPAHSGSGNNVPPESREVTYMTVEDDYFADAVFIGDSRTMGLFEYGGLEETSTFYASTGLTVYKMFEAAIVPGEQGKISVEEALQQNTFAKIYFMIGINEMGTGTVESFLEAYQEAVDHLRELQPDAVIYLQAIIKVTAERSGQGDYINNEGIIARNEGIAQMADNEHVFYLDVNPLICDESGGMIPEYTFDGVHLKALYIDIWKEFLKSHAIDFS
ncbi:MAG: hypothetical protein HFH93_00755 [Lachnospiraceae bacterium]|nr:hypothetical protein [Lachnospiraceae bacterium]